MPEVITFKVSVIKRQADAVQPEALEELGVLLLEEILQKLREEDAFSKEKMWTRSTNLVEKEGGFLGSEYVCESSTDLELTPRVAGYKVLHAARDGGKLSQCWTRRWEPTSSIHRDQLLVV